MSQRFDTLKRETDFSHPSDTRHQYPELQRLTLPHILSFNSLFHIESSRETTDSSIGLLNHAIADLGHKVVFDGKTSTERPLGNKLSCIHPFKRVMCIVWIEDVIVTRPMVAERDVLSLNRFVYPTECRERASSYTGRLSIKVGYKVNDGPVQVETRACGSLPIMVRSRRCNLHDMGPKALVAHGEESEELGGYFVVNGNEKIIRLLIVTKRNHVLGVVRPSFQKRGSLYTPYGCIIRCVRPDQSSLTVGLHYLSNGVITFKFHWKKQEYLVPVMMVLKALMETSDREVFDLLLQGQTHNTFLLDRIELLFRNYKVYGVHTRDQCLRYLGDKFRVVMQLPEDWNDRTVGEALLRKVCLVHLQNEKDKFHLMVFMMRKLYALVAGECAPDNPDSPQFQEVLLAGHLLSPFIKEKLEDWMNGVRVEIGREIRRTPGSVSFDKQYVSKIFLKVPADVGQKVNYLLATGNLVSGSGLDLQQTSGYTIVAEKLNFLRYLAHFRCIHRGAFFAELKTTTVRKLLPEAWGFLCPVHTPDGAPCGLLNHLAHTCEVVTYVPDVSTLPKTIVDLGVVRVGNAGATEGETLLTIQLDGQVLGQCSASTAERVAKQLRWLKLHDKQNIPRDLEIGWVPPSTRGQYPGLYLFSGPARMTRPVEELSSGLTDYIGPFEQVYMNIACLDDEIIPGVSTHRELAPTNMLSVIANLTPFSDFNQSPRNMYQCQMGKQSMGTPAQALQHRTDNKLYRLQCGQTPIVRPKLYNDFGMDGFPNGMNAVVAVLSYTGYDMEDAMILNKSSHERGFGYGSIYKVEEIDLSEKRRRGEPISHFFGVGEDRKGLVASGKLDTDGFPKIGTRLQEEDPLYACYDQATNKTFVKLYKGPEIAYVDQVRLVSGDDYNLPCQQALIKLRIPRPPIIGDKFSSRHGQKGVCSQKWPAVDMPWTASGIQPDVIINPHAFPSRMTIGMFVESIAGKAGALHGVAQDATPFQFDEQHTAADFFGEQLTKAGYNFHGNEPMYSGITGEEFSADIFIGVVYYQRLRHMVSDKYQVRTTGPVHALTQQPVKGRKRAGGIRFGEMERDSLLAHGTSFLLQDRLMNCSDYSRARVCSKCGTIVGVVGKPLSSASSLHSHDGGPKMKWICMVCDQADPTQAQVREIAVPYVFRYLATELMAMNIKLHLKLDE
jgi:DNA-directed RNA polymerase I subunit RPA2